jgi:RNA polymerase sigma-70 factor, ECF subfamily
LTPQPKHASISGNVATQTGQLTELLRRGSQGDQAAMDQVIPLVYQQLRRLAARHLWKQPPDHSHQPTSLVHEAYLRLVDRSQAEVRCRTHFFNLASTVMRQVLVDHARARLASKRGGHQIRVEFEEALVASNEKARDVVALDEALKALAALDERRARVLELRYFGGLSIEETAETLGVSTATIGREARYAEAWLRRELQSSGAAARP